MSIYDDFDEDDEVYDKDYEDYDNDYDDHEEYDDFDEDDLDDELDEIKNEDGYHDTSYYEALGIEDGRFDKDHHMFPQSGFGSSVNLDELDDDQREAYELGYNIGAEDYDLDND